MHHLAIRLIDLFQGLSLARLNIEQVAEEYHLNRISDWKHNVPENKPKALETRIVVEGQKGGDTDQGIEEGA